MEKIRIGPFDYTYREEKDLSNEEGEELYGEIRYKENIISMLEGLPPPRRAHTLMHEIVHGMLSNMAREDLNSDEPFVDALALNVVQFMRDNPDITMKILSDINTQ
ncbi:hypothetical protein [Aminobacterium colombiense]